jgi:phosphoglycolate phosphatase
MAYDLAIFDFDGTLADTAEWFASALNETAVRYGFRQLSEDEFVMLRGKSNRDIVRYLQIPWWKIPAIARHMRQRAAEHASSLRLFPCVPEMMRDLRGGGMKIAIVSSNSESTIRSVLQQQAPVDFFECGASPFGKATLIRRVLKRSKITAGRAIAIGDETRDIEAGRAARVATGAVAWGYALPELLASMQPDFMFKDVAGIADAILPDRQLLE